MEQEGDIRRLSVDGREVIIIGTAHISKTSVDIVRETIEQEKPDVVCVELDERRYKALSEASAWEKLDLFEVIRNKQAPFLFANLILSSYQRRMGQATGVKPGAELAAAASVAKEAGAEVVLFDRDIRTTLLRIWRTTPFHRKMMLISMLIASAFGFGEKQEIDEEALQELRKGDALSMMLEEMGSSFPSIKKALVDERDTFMASHIQKAPGKKIVAVIGAAHMPGICAKVHTPISDETIEEISQIPKRSFLTRALPWLIPAIVVGLFVYGFLTGDTTKVKEAAFAWILANGIFCAVGTIIALGHPLTVIAGFIAAPITSLNPAIGAGFVTGLVQTKLVPPLVSDMENLSRDIESMKGWWTNRFARVLLVFFLSSAGSSLGTFAAFGWLKNLLSSS